MNTQLPTKPVKTVNPEALLIHSVFYTIQGEGPFAGSPAVFVRLGGCNIQCPFCDTEYTAGAKLTDIKKVVTLVQALYGESRYKQARPQAYKQPLVVITGGEPFRQSLYRFVIELHKAGFRIQIETNGTLFDPLLDYGIVTIICSPKTGSVNKHLQPYIHSYKYVIEAGHVSPVDGLPTRALGLNTKFIVFRPPVNFFGEIYVQALDEGELGNVNLANKKHLNAAIVSSMQFGYTFCLQIHKQIGMK